MTKTSASSRVADSIAGATWPVSRLVAVTRVIFLLVLCQSNHQPPTTHHDEASVASPSIPGTERVIKRFAGLAMGRPPHDKEEKARKRRHWRSNPPDLAPRPPTVETRPDTTGGAGDVASRLIQQNNAELPGPSRQLRRRPRHPAPLVSRPSMQELSLRPRAPAPGSGLTPARICLVMNQMSDWKYGNVAIDRLRRQGEGKPLVGVSDHFASFLGFKQNDFKGSKRLQHHLGPQKIKCRSTINLTFQMADNRQKKEDVGVWRAVEGDRIPFDVMIDPKIAHQYTVSEDLPTPPRMPPPPPPPPPCPDPCFVPPAMELGPAEAFNLPAAIPGGHYGGISEDHSDVGVLYYSPNNTRSYTGSNAVPQHDALDQEYTINTQSIATQAHQGSYDVTMNNTQSYPPDATINNTQSYPPDATINYTQSYPPDATINNTQSCPPDSYAMVHPDASYQGYNINSQPVATQFHPSGYRDRDHDAFQTPMANYAPHNPQGPCIVDEQDEQEDLWSLDFTLDDLPANMGSPPTDPFPDDQV
ncbi:hypothetical protein G7Z17_g13646 [Cylindrodendrum hubeiense]|uniref:Uncharacterized protein n=1 Tax=Cylindrodendrum hubeiense TaxID=595255 RepID=A0A9P5GYI7_9HYPO|nr:hypothetical protein G7Z17_g13646 [Cylindrodendrum hubeiense]